MKRCEELGVYFCEGGGKGIVKPNEISIPAALHLGVFFACLQFGVPYSENLTNVSPNLHAGF